MILDYQGNNADLWQMHGIDAPRILQRPVFTLQTHQESDLPKRLEHQS